MNALQMLYPREMEYSLAPVKEQEERWKAISSYIDEHLFATDSTHSSPLL
jgi:hypothetical protein